MHALLLPLVIVSAVAASPQSPPLGDVGVIFAQRFDMDAVRTFDNWPPGWARKRGPGFPEYLPIEISPDEGPTGPGSLKMQLNGGGAVLFSPEIAIDARHSYRLETMIRTAGLQQDSAYVSVTLLGPDHAPLATYRSAYVGHSTPWTTVSIGPLTINHPTACWMLIGLHLEPTQPPTLWKSEDLKGTAWFDEIIVTQLPALRLSADHPLHLYPTGKPATFTCELSGFVLDQTTLTLQLRDAFGEPVSDPYQADIADLTQSPAVDEEDGAADLPNMAVILWRPDPLPEGFYQLHAMLEFNGDVILQQSTTMAVVGHHFNRSGRGDFGWSLSSGQYDLDVEPLSRLLLQAGLHWAKLPAWIDPEQPKRADDLVWLTERLQSLRIEPVGLLMDPPKKIRTALIEQQIVPPAVLKLRAPRAAETFALPPDIWYPEVEYTLTQLSTLVRWWQLGSDDDYSLMEEPRLRPKVKQVKKQLDKIGMDLSVGFAWDWLRPLPDEGQQAPWRYLAMSARPSLAPDELEAYLKAEQPRDVQRWVSITPLPAEVYDVQQRVLDLVHRMLVARSQGASAVILDRPFDRDRGVVHSDGTPGVLFVPWRTLAQAISGAEYLGALDLPASSPNQVYRRSSQSGDEIVVVVWNAVPTAEVMYLGEQTKCFDVWGRPQSMQPTADGGQMFEVGPWPVIVRSREAALVSSQLSLKLERTDFPPDLGHTYDNAISLQNEFIGGATGTVKLVLPPRWKATPDEFTMELAPGQTWREPFRLRIPYDSDTGRQLVRIDVDLMADRPYRYSIYRALRVGEDDLQLEVVTRLLSDNQLIVEQRTFNRSDKAITLVCDLFAPGRRRMRQPVGPIPPGMHVEQFVLEDAAELVGETLWLRVQQRGTPYVLNRRFEVQP